MANTIKLKNSGTSSNVPSSLEYGELAINYADGKLFYKDSGGSIVEFTAAASPAGSDGQVQYNNGGSFGGASGLHYDDGNNRLGIGTTSPDRALTVDSTETNVANFKGANATAAISFMGSGTTDNTQVRIAATGDAMKLFTGSAERVRIDSSGDVGIGTTAPDNKLHVQLAGTSKAPTSVPATHMIIADAGDTNDAGIAVYSATTGKGYMRFGDSDASAQGGFSYDHATNELKMRTAGGERVTIDSSGNLGIGTTSPAYKLDVNGDVNFNGSQVHLRGTGNYPNALNFHTSGTEGYFWHMSAPREIENHAWKLWWYDGSAYSLALTVDTDGDTTTGGALNTNTINLNTSVHLTNVDADGSMRVQGNNGYIDVGPKNSTYCHIYTDRGSFYFNKTTLYANSTSNKIWHRGDLKGGATSVAVNSSGYGTINHGLGATPDFAFVGARTRLSNGNDNQLSFPITSYNSTSITFRAYEINGDGNSNYSSSTIFNATVYVFWMVGNQ